MAKRKKLPAFTFEKIGVPFGAELEPAFTKNGKPVVGVFWQRKGEKVRALIDRLVECDGIQISLYRLTGLLLEKIKGSKPATYQASRFWKYEGERIDERHKRMCILRDAKKGKVHA